MCSINFLLTYLLTQLTSVSDINASAMLWTSVLVSPWINWQTRQSYRSAPWPWLETTGGA